MNRDVVLIRWRFHQRNLLSCMYTSAADAGIVVLISQTAYLRANTHHNSKDDDPPPSWRSASSQTQPWYKSFDYNHDQQKLTQGQGSTAVPLRSSQMRATRRMWTMLCLKTLGQSLILGQVSVTSNHVTVASCSIGCHGVTTAYT